MLGHRDTHTTVLCVRVSSRTMSSKPLVLCLSQQGPLRRIWSLGALGEGSGWDLRVRPSAAAEAAASAAAASGNLGIWGPKNQKTKVLKIQIRSAQNVGKVWISRKKIFLALFGAI